MSGTFIRARRRLNPIASFGLAVGVGALIPLSMLLVSFFFPKEVSLVTILASPFVCGFSAGIVFRTDPLKGVVRSVLLGIVAYLVFFAGLFALAIFTRSESIAFVIYIHFTVVFFIPIFIVVPPIGSVLGALVGRAVGGAVERRLPTI